MAGIRLDRRGAVKEAVLIHYCLYVYVCEGGGTDTLLSVCVCVCVNTYICIVCVCVCVCVCMYIFTYMLRPSQTTHIIYHVPSL